MGKRGPAPKPTVLRLIEGNPSRRPLNKHEPQPRPIRPACPKWLTPDARKEWNRIVPELERMGLLTVVDGAALSAYCQEWGRYVDAQAQIGRYGLLLKPTASGYIQQSPYLSIARKSLQAVRALASEFGLTPAARTRIQVPKGETEDDWPELD